ncbi:GNAT family N-acetyltransferase [Allorhizobium sp. BGMRC 0089]|uniref:GNAT family N-acetyltransferase n=1 Tax=Allorhizobium sonneratiae TaxID=2934936 RepID=UPI002033839D|nr:N-acetyltransferase [Allorhizobium sonneratiae]MCM2294293.1 GNAT family N-acetyltransferase [Allorhizobium sonneratiae]
MSSSKLPENSPRPSGGEPFILREMRQADLERIGLVGWESWRSTGPLDRSMADPAVAQRVRDAFLSFPFCQARDVVIAEVDGVMAGWGARKTSPELISDIWVLPDFQRRGIGRALVTSFCDRMRGEGLRQALISTHQNNFAAQALYRHCGFETVWRGMERDAAIELDIAKVRLRRFLL